MGEKKNTNRHSYGVLQIWMKNLKLKERHRFFFFIFQFSNIFTI